MAIQDVFVPDIGSFDSVDVIEVLVKELIIMIPNRKPFLKQRNIGKYLERELNTK